MLQFILFWQWLPRMIRPGSQQSVCPLCPLALPTAGSAINLVDVSLWQVTIVDGCRPAADSTGDISTCAFRAVGHRGCASLHVNMALVRHSC